MKRFDRLQTRVSGPQGDFEVSTVQTFAGGAADSRPTLSPFSLSDYADENPWPFETMVFRLGSSRGLYHEPHASEMQARDGHTYAVSLIKAGTLIEGTGVRGDFGVPSITPDEWKDRFTSAKA